MYSCAHFVAAMASASTFRFIRREDYGCQANLFHRCLAEYLGSMFICLTLGLNNIISDAALTKALSVGGVAMSMYYIMGNKSGGHFNPCVSIAAVLTGRKRNSKLGFVCYLLAQIFGSMGGTMIHFLILGKVWEAKVGPDSREGADNGTSWWSTIWAEAFFTGAMCFSYLSIWLKNEPVWKMDFAGLVVGNTFFFCYFCCQTISGGHFNPAISLATGVSAHTDNKEGSQMFIYMFAQFVGCFVGVVMFSLCRPAGGAP